MTPWLTGSYTNDERGNRLYDSGALAGASGAQVGTWGAGPGGTAAYSYNGTGGMYGTDYVQMPGYGGGGGGGGYGGYSSSAYTGGMSSYGGGGGGGYSYGSATPRSSRAVDPSMYFNPARSRGDYYANDVTNSMNNAQMNQFGMRQMEADMAAQAGDLQHRRDMELLQAKLSAERGSSAADRAFAMQKLQAEMQIAREQNAMSQWATYMDMQNAEQNRLAQMEQQRRGFLDNAYGRQDNAYYSYGIS